MQTAIIPHVKLSFHPLFLVITFAKNSKSWILLHSLLSSIRSVQSRSRTASHRIRWTNRSSAGTIEKAKPSGLAFLFVKLELSCPISGRWVAILVDSIIHGEDGLCAVPLREAALPMPVVWLYPKDMYIRKAMQVFMELI